MHIVNYSEARAHLKVWMDKTWEDASPVVITRSGKAKPVVMMSLEAYNSIEETMYLLRTKANADNLRNAVEQVRKRNYKRRKLIDV